MNRDLPTLTTKIATEGAIGMVLRKHAALICWNDHDASPVYGIANNGTRCFVEGERSRFIVTCGHVSHLEGRHTKPSEHSKHTDRNISA